jgi:tetratricopeptide (TPR) repeat protein
LEGLAFKFVPAKGPYWQNLDPEKMWAHFSSAIPEISKEPQVGFLWRGLQDSSVYLDEDSRRLMANYRQAFFSLGYHYANVKRDPSRFAVVLDRMESVIPRNVISMPLGMKIDIANYYKLSGREDTFRALLNEVIAATQPVVARKEHPPVSQNNPYILLLQAYEALQDYKNALETLEALHQIYSTEQGVDQFVVERRTQLEMMMQVMGKQDTNAGRGQGK